MTGIISVQNEVIYSGRYHSPQEAVVCQCTVIFQIALDAVDLTAGQNIHVLERPSKVQNQSSS